MAKSKWIITSLIIIILALGVYIFLGNSNQTLEDKSTSSEKQNCNVGESVYTPNPDGVAAGGQITGIESHKFINGETLNLCCNDASDLQEINEYKSCTYSQNNIITHEILWKKINGVLVKIKEVEPESNSICTYYFDNNGEFESRMCSPQ